MKDSILVIKEVHKPLPNQDAIKTQARGIARIIRRAQKKAQP